MGAEAALAYGIRAALAELERALFYAVSLELGTQVVQGLRDSIKAAAHALEAF